MCGSWWMCVMCSMPQNHICLSWKEFLYQLGTGQSSFDLNMEIAHTNYLRILQSSKGALHACSPNRSEASKTHLEALLLGSFLM